MIISVIYLLVRCLLGCLTVLSRAQASKDAELLVLRHENAVLPRQAGRVRYQPGDRLWRAALSRLVPRRRWDEVFPVTLVHHAIRDSQGSGGPGHGQWPDHGLPGT